MVAPSFKERVRRLGIALRVWFFWLSARGDTPKGWFSGSYSRIKLLRLSLTVVALLCYSAFSLGTNFTTATFLNLWFGLASSGYIILALIYILGLRMWYAPTVLFLIGSAAVNMVLNSAGGPLGVGIATPAFASAALVLWLYLLIVSLIAMRYDKGSKINEMLQQS